MNKVVKNADFFLCVEREISAGRAVTIRVKGISMLPFLRDGRDEAVLAPCNPELLRRGDVVLFRNGGIYLLHRIIGKKGPLWELMGDGNLVLREHCSNRDIVAKLQAVRRPCRKVRGVPEFREIAVSSRKWRWMSALWMSLGPLRRPALKLVHILMH